MAMFVVELQRPRIPSFLHAVKTISCIALMIIFNATFSWWRLLGSAISVIDTFSIPEKIRKYFRTKSIKIQNSVEFIPESEFFLSQLRESTSLTISIAAIDNSGSVWISLGCISSKLFCWILNIHKRDY